MAEEQRMTREEWKSACGTDKCEACMENQSDQDDDSIEHVVIANTMQKGSCHTPVSDWLVLEDLAEHVYGHMRSFNLNVQVHSKDGFLDHFWFPTWQQADEGTMNEYLLLVAASHALTTEWEACVRHLQAIISNVSCGWVVGTRYSLREKTNPYLAPWVDLSQSVKDWNKAKDRHYKMIFEAATGLKLRPAAHDDQWMQQEIKAGAG